MSTWMTEHIVPDLITAIVSLFVTLFVGYLIYRFNQRAIVSIGIYAKTMVKGPIAEIVITNHGRSPIVVTELKIEIPGEQLLPELFEPSPTFDEQQVRALIRRRINVPFIMKDARADAADKALSNSAGSLTMLPPTETIKIGPGEKASRPLGKSDQENHLPKVELPRMLTLVPSCKLGKKRQRILGWPVIVIRDETGDYNFAVLGSEF